MLTVGAPASVERVPGGEAERLEHVRGVADQVYRWGNGPGATYAPHRHAYTKRLTVLRGSIDFHLEHGDVLHMEGGDHLTLQAGAVHSAVVGAAGVECAEGQHRD